MLLALLLNLALATEKPAPIDLDGDGVKEDIVYPTITEANQGDEDLVIKVGKVTVSGWATYDALKAASDYIHAMEMAG